MGDLIVRERNETTLRDLCIILFRHQRKVLWFFLSIVSIAVIATYGLPEVYQSEAKVLVRLGRENVALDPTATTSGQLAQVASRRESEIKSELAILTSRDLAERVVAAIGPEQFRGGILSRLTSFFSKPNPVKQRDATVLQLMKTWRTDNLKDSNIIAISYESPRPKLAHDVVQKLIEAYLEKHLAVNRTPGSYDFFNEQTVKLQEQLQQSEKALEELKNQTGVSSVVEQRRVLVERIGDLQEKIAEANGELATAREKAKIMQQVIKGLPENITTAATAGFPNVAADGMRQKLYDLQLKEQELLSKYTENNFLVKETRRQIGNASDMLKKESSTRNQTTRGVNPIFQQVKGAMIDEQSNLVASQGKIDALESQLAGAREELKALNASEVKLAAAQRERDIQEANYRKYSDKLEQARIDNALDTQKISNISIAQKATYPIRPIRPHKALNLALGFMFGGLGAVGLAFYAEMADHSLKRPEDVARKLKAPLLAAIPHFSGDESLAEVSRKDNLLLLPAVRTECGLMSQFEDCCETLCDRLLHPPAGSEAPNVIAVTSARPGEGVSTESCNLALALARRKNQRILLVEANAHRPSAHKVFGINVTPGLTDVLEDGLDNVTSINCSRSPKLDVIPSGKGEISLSQLADSKEFIAMLNLWKTEYSFVILDMPAIAKTSSILRLASLADGVVLVVEAEKVGHEVVQSAQTQLAQAKANLLGVVLNKRMFHLPEWLYRKL